MSVCGRVSWTAIALIVTLVIVSQSEAYVTSPSLRRRSNYSARIKEDSEVVTKLREDGSKVTLYLYPSKRSITARQHEKQTDTQDCFSERRHKFNH
mmetsp:Transcript_31627/g.75508  ORF Transcript_31627/g.75508 Transcript_31627/m.75508 type:complete len:96 (-) Transcript_31627:619-906(-)